MKNIIYIFFLTLFSVFGIAKEKITISGKIANVEGNKIIVKGERFEKTITLQPDGSFSQTFDIEYSGSYLLLTNVNRINLFLDKESALNITADDKDFVKSLKFSGTHSIENSYWQQKSSLVTKIMGTSQDFYSNDEASFLNKIKDIKNQIQVLYEATKFVSPFFKESEKRNIDYFEQYNYLIYEQYHAYYTKKENFKTSATFPILATTIDLDNENDFLFSNLYKQLVAAVLNQKVSKLAGEDADYTSKFALPEIKKHKSPSIKSFLLQNLSYEVSAGNPDSEMLYKELMSLLTDASLKDKLTTKYNQIKTLSSGKPSPKFDYENFKGGKTSLESLNGKYVYIDVWATWCGPCRREIPFLQKIEEEYKGKNIEFVSLSIDAKKDYDKWRKMVEEKKLGGIQLFADNDWNSQFVKDYAVEGIPRFILIAPNGTIVSADAPRPSDPKLIEKFKELGI